MCVKIKLTESGHFNAYITNGSTGFPIKDARYFKVKKILFLLSDEKEGQIIENIDFKYLSNRASFMANPVRRVLYP